MKINISAITGELKKFTFVKALAITAALVIIVPTVCLHYQKSCEEMIMRQAVKNVNSIAEANRRYYRMKGAYAHGGGLYLLKVAMDGVMRKDKKLETETFIYSPNGDGSNTFIALAQRIPVNSYYIFIDRENDKKIGCYSYQDASRVQKTLCSVLDKKGSI